MICEAVDLEDHMARFDGTPGIRIIPCLHGQGLFRLRDQEASYMGGGGLVIVTGVGTNCKCMMKGVVCRMWLSNSTHLQPQSSRKNRFILAMSCHEPSLGHNLT